MGIDLQKEIKLSDLFRRKAKDPGAARAPEPERKQEKEKAPRRALFARGDRAPKPPKEPKGPKQTAAASTPKGPASLPEIPLMRAFNLLPKEEAREARGRLGLVQVLVALLGLLVVAGLGSAYLLMSARESDKQGQVDALRVQLADLDVPSAGPAEEEGGDASLAVEAQARTTALAGALTGRVAWDRVLREVTLVVPDDVWLTTVTAQTPGAGVVATAPESTDPAVPAEGSSITIVGRARTQDAVARFLSRLGVIPELTSVQLQTSIAEVQDTGTTFSYTIVASVDPAGAPS